MKRPNDGFTLVEVLLAMVLVGAALTVLAQGFTEGSRASVSAQGLTRAALAARSLLAEVEAGIRPHNRDEEGELEETPEMTYRIESEASEPAGMVQIRVSVLWTERGKGRGYALTRLLYRPREESR